jgi:DNA-binding FadR family transcriptional regulator
MAFESGNSAPRVSPSERPPESQRASTDVRTMLPKKGETIKALREVRTSISGIFAAVKNPQNND